ncbi:hypothetical protein [Nostoc sp.]|uniref:hypothetical protein n=1 Tax=Nostoc sp. TaxID=1180 RepID=UPI002FF5CDF7
MKNSTHKGDGVFGHEEWGMAKKLPMPNAQCPKRRGTIPLHLQEDGVSRRFR